MAKTYRRLEDVVRGFANHRRIEVLFRLDSGGELDLTEIAEQCGINIKTASAHLRRMSDTGLVHKQAKGQRVLHSLSPVGKKVLIFLRTLESLPRPAAAAGRARAQPAPAEQ